MGYLLNSKIEEILKGYSINDLSKEREKLTSLYRRSDSKSNLKALSADSQRLAYLATRLPATYAVVYKVLMEMLLRSSNETISSLLDIGAGPGTALLAAMQASLPLKAATMVERDAGFIALGKHLTRDLEHVEQEWVCRDVNKIFNTQPHDLVIASYSLNELKEEERLLLVGRLWELTGKFLIIVEPGTKAAFESLKKMRQALLLKGGYLMAPCPHSNPCPLPEKEWCHFGARIERSSLHRKTKDATLNYEDEKFSYLIFSKNKFEPCHSRILRRPFKGEGFVKLQLCSRDGLESKTVTKKNKPQYLYTRKVEYGDDFVD